MTEPVTMPLPGAPAPALDLNLIVDAEWELSAQSPESYTLIVFYRGLHCPICKSYLQGLRETYDDWLGKGVEIIHVSMDTREKATEAHEEWKLDPVPMGYGLTEDQARAWGLYLSEGMTEKEPGVFSEPGLFMVKPDGTLYFAEVASSPVVRPNLELLLGSIDFIKEKDYPPRGTKAA